MVEYKYKDGTIKVHGFSKQEIEGKIKMINEGYNTLLARLLSGHSVTGKMVINKNFTIDGFVSLVRSQTSLRLLVEKIGKTTYIIPKHNLHKTATTSTLPTLHAYWCEKFLSEELPKHELNYNEVKV